MSTKRYYKGWDIWFVPRHGYLSLGDWFARRKGVQIGPFSYDELLTKIDEEEG